MNRRQAIAWVALAPFAVFAQTNDTLSLDDLLDQGQQFMADNVDEDVLAQFGEVDPEKVRALLKQLQDAFNQNYVLDLPALKAAAQAGLKLLASSPDTEPYADWLRPRLDYFDVANQLDQATPRPESKAEKPFPRKPTPPAELEETVWTQALKDRPAPPAAAKYEANLKRIFKRYAVPPQLFWLAEVESDFNPKARSPAGAVGLYQLMPSTARSLGLSTWPFDERKNPEKNAEAAARYLHQLYLQFHDWRLAIAAYNAGQGRVREKLEHSQAKTFKAIAAELPSETQLYVPKLNAILERREGITLAKLPKVS